MSSAISKPEGSNITDSQNQTTHQANIKPAEGFQLKPTRLAVHKITKQVFGRIVPFYHLCVESDDENKQILQSVDIPAARFEEAMQLMKLAYDSDEQHPDEGFAQWGARKGYPFFTELLEDILSIGPDDLPHLLNIDVSNDQVNDAGLNIV